MRKKELQKMNDMAFVDQLTHAEVNQVKGGAVKVEGTLSIKISNLKL